MSAFDHVPRSMAAEDAWREERLAIVAALCRADALLARDPDAAALELDGLLYRIARVWCQARAGGLPPSDLLQPPASDAPLFALRLRLALCAPDARARLARLAHLWWLVGETVPAQTTTRPPSQPPPRGARSCRCGIPTATHYTRSADTASH